MTSRLRSQIAGTAAAIMVAVGGPAALWAVDPATTKGTRPFDAGEWLVITQINNLDIPGLPDRLEQAMAADSQTAKPRSVCIGPYPDGRPPVALFDASGAKCAYESWDAAGETITAVLSCQPPSGSPGTIRIRLTGTYRPDRFALRSLSTVRDTDGNVQLRMSALISATLASSCSGRTAGTAHS